MTPCGATWIRTRADPAKLLAAFPHRAGEAFPIHLQNDERTTMIIEVRDAVEDGGVDTDTASREELAAACDALYGMWTRAAQNASREELAAACIALYEMWTRAQPAASAE